MEHPFTLWFLENWEVVFLYLFKQLQDIKTTIAIHGIEIKNLKAT